MAAVAGLAGTAVAGAACAGLVLRATTGADFRFGGGVTAGRETTAEAGRGEGAASEAVLALAEFVSGEGASWAAGVAVKIDLESRAAGGRGMLAAAGVTVVGGSTRAFAADSATDGAGGVAARAESARGDAGPAEEPPGAAVSVGRGVPDEGRGRRSVAGRSPGPVDAGGRASAAGILPVGGRAGLEAMDDPVVGMVGGMTRLPEFALGVDGLPIAADEGAGVVEAEVGVFREAGAASPGSKSAVVRRVIRLLAGLTGPEIVLGRESGVSSGFGAVSDTFPEEGADGSGEGTVMIRPDNGCEGEGEGSGGVETGGSDAVSALAGEGNGVAGGASGAGFRISRLVGGREEAGVVRKGGACNGGAGNGVASGSAATGSAAGDSVAGVSEEGRR